MMIRFCSGCVGAKVYSSSGLQLLPLRTRAFSVVARLMVIVTESPPLIAPGATAPNSWRGSTPLRV